MTTPSAVVTYLWDGTKVRTSSALGQGRLYKGSFVYSVTSTDTQLESIGHDEGRILASEGASGTEFIDTWHVRDYLGSVRAIYDISTPADEVADANEQILEQSDYYAFGGRIETPNQAYAQANRYRYNGKEQLRFESLNLDPGLTDYGARYYAPTFGHWTTIDPMADKYYNVSPYAFCNNNPVNYIDPNGEAVETLWDIASIGMGVRSFVKNIKSGNFRGAVGDALGVAVDAVAAAVPFVPGGVGAVRAGAKAVNAIDNAADATKSVKTASKAEEVCSTIRTTETSLGNTKYSKTGGENVSTKLGREKHKEYNPGNDYIKEFRLPSGKRVDAVSFEKADVRELKPNNSKAIKRGEKQVQSYREELQTIYPEIKWEYHIDVYDK